MKRQIILAASLLFALAATEVNAGRKFNHPGISYTRADLDRMKAMVEAKQEPYYTSFTALKNDSRSSKDYKISKLNPTVISSDVNPDSYFTSDGHAAHNMALLWHLTDDEEYAKKAVEIINNYNSLKCVGSRGTGPLNSGKIHLLIEAAELMRDYTGWLDDDKNAFKAMLVHPGYSTVEDMYKLHASSDDEKNNITWYWNAYNFDSGRHGNQELFPARMLMGMGIFLDNDTIYDRAVRYFADMGARPDDLPYITGPRLGMTPKEQFSSYYKEQSNAGSYLSGEISNYGYNGVLKYCIWENGQGQESSRDQGHGMGAISLCGHIAEIAWNQGDNLYDLYDNRILLGLEWTCRYNLTYLRTFPDQRRAWEPTGYVTGEFEDGDSGATFENGKYIRRWDRTKRWYSLKPSPYFESDTVRISRGTAINRTSNAIWAQHYNHYKYRMKMPEQKMLWLQRTMDYNEANYGIEGNGHTTDWLGWGGLTKTRTGYMSGDPVSFASGEKVLGMHKIPCVINAVDYDFFTGDGQGRTYKNISTEKNLVYRTDGTVEIAFEDGIYVVDKIENLEWMHYTVAVSRTMKYNIYATYRTSSSGSLLEVSFDGGTPAVMTMPVSSEFTEIKVGKLDLKQGAGVIKVKYRGDDNAMQLVSIRIEESGEKVSAEKVTLKGEELGKLFAGQWNRSFNPATAGSPSLCFDNDTTNNGALGHQIYSVFDLAQEASIISLELWDASQKGTLEVYVTDSDAVPGSSEFIASLTQVGRTNGTSKNGTIEQYNNLTVTGGRYIKTGPISGNNRYVIIYDHSNTANLAELIITLKNSNPKVYTEAGNYFSGIFYYEGKPVASDSYADLYDSDSNSVAVISKDEYALFDLGRDVKFARLTANIATKGNDIIYSDNFISVTPHGEGISFADSRNILCTDGSEQNGIPVVSHSDSDNAHVTVGPFNGRYLYVYNKSGLCRISEISFDIDYADNIEELKIKAQSLITNRSGYLSVPDGYKMDIYSVTGSMLCRSAGSFRPGKGIFVIRIYSSTHVSTEKVIIR